MQEQDGVVPQLWHVDIGSVPTQAERRGWITAGDTAARIEPLHRLPIVTDDEIAGRALRNTALQKATFRLGHGLLAA